MADSSTDDEADPSTDDEVDPSTDEEADTGRPHDGRDTDRVVVRRVAGGNDPTDVIEPGDVDPENALFFGLGVLLGVFVVVTLLVG